MSHCHLLLWTVFLWCVPDPSDSFLQPVISSLNRIPKLCPKFGCGALHLLHTLLDEVSVASLGRTNCSKVLRLGWFTCGFDVLHSIMNKDTSMGVFVLSVCTVILKHKHKNI